MIGKEECEPRIKWSESLLEYEAIANVNISWLINQRVKRYYKLERRRLDPRMPTQ